MLIPTQSKQPLPHEHSYPIGAQAITGALAKVPQLAELGLSFYSFNKFHYESCGNCLVLAAEYRHLHVGLSASNIMVEEGWYEPCWQVAVYAVPRKNRHAINIALVSMGLSAVEEWLCEARTETWLDSFHRIGLEFSADSGELLTREVDRR